MLCALLYSPTERGFTTSVYTSVIGVTKYMAVYGLNSGCAAALVVARRGESSPYGGSPAVGNWRTRKGQNRTERLPKRLDSYFKKPEDKLKSGAWRQVAKKINICGGFNRHKWYSLGIKQARTNSSLYSKLRQTKAPSGRDTVQVLVTPHIRKNPRAMASLKP